MQLLQAVPVGGEVAAAWRGAAPEVTEEERTWDAMYGLPRAAAEAPSHEVVHDGNPDPVPAHEGKQTHAASFGWHEHPHADGSGGQHSHLHEHQGDANHQPGGSGVASHVHDPAGPPLEAAGRGVRAGIAAQLRDRPAAAAESDDEMFRRLFGNR